MCTFTADLGYKRPAGQGADGMQNASVRQQNLLEYKQINQTPTDVELQRPHVTTVCLTDTNRFIFTSSITSQRTGYTCYKTSNMAGRRGSPYTVGGCYIIPPYLLGIGTTRRSRTWLSRQCLSNDNCNSLLTFIPYSALSCQAMSMTTAGGTLSASRSVSLLQVCPPQSCLYYYAVNKILAAFALLQLTESAIKTCADHRLTQKADQLVFPHANALDAN